MRSLVCVGSMLAVAVVAAACGNSNEPIIYPGIGGTYTGNVTYEVAGFGSVVPGITIQMNDPDGNGNFAGTFQFNTGYTETGTIYGQFSSDGSTINWEQFGDTNEPLFYVGAFLAQAFPSCAFQGAVFSLNENGGFDANGDLDLNGQYAGVRCATGTAGDTDTTTMGVSLVSNNPNPYQRVAKALNLHALLRGGVQRVK
jgi:hypothetical protein